MLFSYLLVLFNNEIVDFISDWTETDLSSFLVTFTPLSLIPGQFLNVDSGYGSNREGRWLWVGCCWGKAVTEQN